MFFKFKDEFKEEDLPSKFTFPFYYVPHPIAIQAAEEVQGYLERQDDFVHNFGLDPEAKGIVIGKMFGVLVVRNQEGELGYLRAFSGKLADSNEHTGFVPPVFDVLYSKGFYKKEEAVVSSLNAEVESLEASEEYLAAKKTYHGLQREGEEKIKAMKVSNKEGKKKRKELRTEGALELGQEEYKALVERLREESIKSNYRLRDLIKYWDHRIGEARTAFLKIEDKIIGLKKERRERSSALQDQIFSRYTFLNSHQENKSLLDLFMDSPNKRPPAGAGECAAPKLLQYAFLNHLQPLALAEFWWGESPPGEVRRHGNFYPACQGKCKPILTHMLSSTDTDEDPLLINPGAELKIQVVYEDEHLAVVNKPPEFLSVPGRYIKDSVQNRMKVKFPDATGPLVVHRLDMSTSGLLLIAKSIEVYKLLQRQFSERKVYKRYVALLEGELPGHKGEINLPLRLDFDDRPRQMVCEANGKAAKTHWELVHFQDGISRVNLFPKTGRTHQLRVHAAHVRGLNAPILGDDLYGKVQDRLHLHAEELRFWHPVLKKEICIVEDASF